MKETHVNYSGINHVALVTSDMDMTVRFWRDLLGMKLVTGFGGPGYRQYFFKVTERDLITFFEWDGAEPVEEKEHGTPLKSPIAFDHIALGLDSPDDLWRMKAKLEAADVWVSEVIDHGFIHSIYSFDLNGVPIEFSVFVKGVDIVAEPLMADKEPVDAAREGFDPLEGNWPALGSVTPPEERKVYPGLGSGMFDKA